MDELTWDKGASGAARRGSRPGSLTRRPSARPSAKVRPSLPQIEVGDDLKHKAYRALKDAILRKALVAGPLYREQALAAQLGVSRTPVREALLMLATEGWIRYQPRRGVSILEPSPTEIRECFELREALEGYIAEALAVRLPADRLAALDKTVERQSRCLRRAAWTRFLKEARRFHRALVSALGNERITKLYDQVTDHLELFGLRAIAAHREPEAMLAEHRAILDALRAGDGARARSLLVEHIHATMEAVLASARMPS